MSRPDALFFAACALGLIAGCERSDETEASVSDTVAEAPAEAASEPVPDQVPLGEGVPAPAPSPPPATDLPDALPTEPESPEFPLPRLSARGNEPFWAIDVDGTVLIWKTPENQAGKVLPASRTMDAGGLKFTGDDEGQPFELDLRARSCQDTMSGASFEFTAVWTYAGVSQAGCAGRAR